jgi:hypothetical protein
MKYLLIALSLLMVGCIDHPEGWEYEARMPAASKTEDLMAAESMLYSNGYKRVRIKYSVGYMVYMIYATKKEGEGENNENN